MTAFGPRHFKVLSGKKTVGLLSRPDVSCEVATYLQPHETFDIEEIFVDAMDERKYLKLTDGRGWVAECSRKQRDRVVVEEVPTLQPEDTQTNRKRSSGIMEAHVNPSAPSTPEGRATTASTEGTPRKRPRKERPSSRVSDGPGSSDIDSVRKSVVEPPAERDENTDNQVVNEGEQFAEQERAQPESLVASEVAAPDNMSVNKRKLRTAVLIAAGLNANVTTDSLATLWVRAKAGLKVANVGHFEKSEARACACGQKPLMTVYHLRHESSGRRVDVGANCAKLCGLNSKARQEAERALINLKQLEDDPNSKIIEELIMFARENNLLTAEEAKLLRENAGCHVERASLLKMIVRTGLDFSRRTDDEIKSLVRKRKSAKSNADRQALLRLALLGANGRKELIHVLNLKRDLFHEDLLLGNGTTDTCGTPEKASLLALAVSRGSLVEAGALLDALRWQGFHAVAALHAAIKCGQSAFIENYLSHAAVAPPDSVAARLVVQTAGGARCMEALLSWIGRQASSRCASDLLHDMLKWACAVGPTETIERLLCAGAQDSNCDALLSWCERLCGDQEAEAVALPENLCGVEVVRKLLQSGAQASVLTARRLDRNALHLAAAAGDAPLVKLFLELGISPWETTCRPKQTAGLAGLRRIDRKLPLEVARKSSLNTTDAQATLCAHMEKDLHAVRQNEYACYISAEEIELIENHLRASSGRLRWADHKLLRRFEEFARLVHEDPPSARKMAEAKRMELLLKAEAEADADYQAPSKADAEAEEHLS